MTSTIYTFSDHG